MSKAYFKPEREDRHEVTIRLASAGLDAPVMLEVTTNATDGELRGNVKPYERIRYTLDVGHELTVVIED